MVGARELGRWLDASERTVRDLADRDIVVRTARGKYDLEASVIAVVRHQREVAAGRGGEDQILDLTAERARLAREQADGQALKNAVSRGELVPAADVAREWEDMIRTASSAMLTVPARCQERLGLELFQTEMIDREIREALEAISNDTAANDSPEGDDGMEAAAEDDAFEMG